MDLPDLTARLPAELEVEKTSASAPFTHMLACCWGGWGEEEDAQRSGVPQSDCVGIGEYAKHWTLF